MKVFVLTIDEVYEYEGFSHKPMVFTNKDKALDALYELYEDTKKELAENGDDDWMEDDYKKGDSCFSLYPDGYWGTSHYDARVDEVEVEE